jgi:hypothetical protein
MAIQYLGENEAASAEEFVTPRLGLHLGIAPVDTAELFDGANREAGTSPDRRGFVLA